MIGFCSIDRKYITCKVIYLCRFEYSIQHLSSLIELGLEAKISASAYLCRVALTDTTVIRV